MPEPISPYVSLSTRAAWVTCFLVVYAGLCSWGLAEGAFTLWGVNARANDVGMPVEVVNVYTMISSRVIFLAIPVYLGCVISFLVWFYRAHRNLASLKNDDAEYKSGWTVWGFVIPILNLVRPLQMMRETWYGSDPALLGDSPVFLHEGVRRGTPAIVGWWWGLYLVMGIMSRIMKRVGRRIEELPAPSANEFEVYALGTIAASVIAICAAILAVRVIWSITRRQGHRHDLIEGRALPPGSVVT